MEIARPIYDAMMGITKADGPPWNDWTAVDWTSIKPGEPPGKLPTKFSYTSNNAKGLTPSGSSPLHNHARVGIFQKAFGWLAFPGPWIPGAYPLAKSDALFPQNNFFIYVGPHDKQPELFEDAR